MSKSTAVTVASLLVGLLCTLLLFWVWRRSYGESPHGPAVAKQAAPPNSTAPTSETPAASGTVDERLQLLHPWLAALARALARRDARPSEAIVVLKDEAALRRFLDRATGLGLTVVGQLDRFRAVRVRFDGIGALQSDLAANGADYAGIGANNLVTLPSAPSKEDRAAINHVPFGNDTLAFLGASGDRSSWGRGTTIAILDTGVSTDSTFGLGRVTPLDIGLGTSPGGNNAKADGHGTAVAALAAGASGDAPGVAPAANILSIRVTDANATSDLFTIAQGIIAATDAGAKVINISLGGYATGSVLDTAIQYATQNGAVIVAAAGNDQAAQLAWPAADPRVISVGAVDKAEQQVTFSNSGAQLQLTAPGYGVQTAWLEGQRVYVDGTSASAPLVAGSIAALMSRNPSLTAQQAAEILVRTANDTGQPGADSAYGRGILNLATAMNSSNPNYVDTAVSSHYFDAENNRMQFTVQNRSGRTVSGMSLNVTGGGSAQTVSVPSLSPGETYVAAVPVNDVALRTSGNLPFSTQLANPTGVVDQVPANNKRSSVLTAPDKP